MNNQSLKIYLNNVNFSSNSGPNTFAFRLANQLTKMGHSIIETPNKEYDIFLAFIQSTHRPRPEAKTILRLDGIWFSPNDYHMNKPIKKCYDTFDKIIFQSDFDRQMIHTHFGYRQGTVINNGIELKRYPKYQMMPDSFDNKYEKHYYFVCSASWHGQKRLIPNILLFKQINKQLKDKNIDSTLIILGNVDNKLQEQVLKAFPPGSPERIAFFGNRSHEDCLSIYSSSHCAIDLQFCGHCPNVSVEQLSQDIPIIYASDGGGMKEIVKNNGLVVESTQEYNFDLCDYDNPPLLKINDFILPDEFPKVLNADYIDIEKVAKKYLEVMQND